MKPRLASFMDYYYETMYPSLKMLEAKRLQILSTLKKVALMLLISAAILFFFLVHNASFLPLEAFLLSTMSSVLLFAFLYRHECSGYGVLFKDLVIEPMIHFMDSSLRYSKMGSMREDEFVQSELFTESYDRFLGHDLVSGMIDGVDVRFCDLHVEKKVRDTHDKEVWEDVFQGLFFVADFNKSFHSKVIVLPDIAEKNFGILGSWMQGMNRQRGELIKLDHVEFEKFFVVYGSDQIESRYILSHALMERIVQFHTQTKQPLSLSFVDSKMYLALHYTKPLFEPILVHSLLEFDSIKAHFERLAMIVGIVSEFNLNEKLWSKR